MSFEGSKSKSGHTQPHLTLTNADYEEYLRYQANKQSSSAIASITHFGNSVACLTQSSPLWP